MRLRTLNPHTDEAVDLHTTQGHWHSPVRVTSRDSIEGAHGLEGRRVAGKGWPAAAIACKVMRMWMMVEQSEEGSAK